MAQKYYVVWSGRETGVFMDWAAHPARRGAVCRRALQIFRNPGGSGASVPSSRLRNRFRPSHLASKDGTLQPGERRAAHIAHRLENVTIYCDGACDPNPGNAASGIVVYRAGKLAELWYGLYDPMGTNNTAGLEHAVSCVAYGRSRARGWQQRRGVQRLSVLHQLHSPLGPRAGKREAGRNLAVRSEPENHPGLLRNLPPDKRQTHAHSCRRACRHRR